MPTKEHLSVIFDRLIEVDRSFSFLKPTLEVGWIDCDGQFWGVSEGAHSILTTRGFKMYGYRPVEQGWVCVGGIKDQIQQRSWSVYRNGKPAEPNDKQKEALKKIGFIPENKYAGKNDSICFSDVFPDGYSHHRLPPFTGELDDLRPAEEIAEEDAVYKRYQTRVRELPSP